MSEQVRQSRVGFAVIKISVGCVPYHLMRINDKWKDINFIGGHEKERDRRDLERTARRELWEEVPSIREYSDFALHPLTSELHYGPIESRSKGKTVQYELRFFLLTINRSPETLIGALSARTKNIWVPEGELSNPRRFRVSGLVGLLQSSIPGGLQAVAYSSAIDLEFMRDRIATASSKQMELALL